MTFADPALAPPARARRPHAPAMPPRAPRLARTLRLRRLVGLACLGLALPWGAWADGPHDSGRRGPAPALYVQECGSCHLAFPARMLPAASWQRLLGGLNRHFGTDASLDPAALQSLSAWLVGRQPLATTDSAALPAQDRITRSAWFVRQHHDLRPQVFQRDSVGSPANCAACHRQATQGRFEEDEVRIPR